jgi:transcriptional regulator with XRE-family HTH domain
MASAGSDRLTRYLARNELTLEAFAGRVGTSKALVHYWRSGAKRPGTEYAVAIERETGIPPKAWLRPAPVARVGPGSASAPAGQSSNGSR